MLLVVSIEAEHVSNVLVEGSFEFRATDNRVLLVKRVLDYKFDENLRMNVLQMFFQISNRVVRGQSKPNP